MIGVLLEHLASVPDSGLTPLVPGIMEASLSGWRLEASEIREYSHGLWASAAKVGNHTPPGPPTASHAKHAHWVLLER